jgi:2-hydroxychromene-2-carboxylate isomerase
VSQVLDELRLSASDLLRAAQSEENKLRLREQTAEAGRRGVFGAPTFFVGREMYWGNDRLEDALSFAANQAAR